MCKDSKIARKITHPCASSKISSSKRNVNDIWVAYSHTNLDTATPCVELLKDTQNGENILQNKLLHETNKCITKYNCSFIELITQV